MSVINGDAPAVTVLLPVYNAAPYLAEAVESVLAQSWTDFELLLLDDGSTDESWAMIQEYARRDGRVRAERAMRNQGLPATLNTGIALARGELVARMDADDMSLPDRLQAQVALMRAQPEVDICGGGMRVFGAANYLIRHPVRDAEIRCELLFSVPLAHPTVIFRRATLLRAGLRYTPGLRDAPEDYDLWVRALPHAVFANLPRPLLRYRSHPEQKSLRFERRYLDDFLAMLAAQQRLAGLEPTPADIQAHYSFWNRVQPTRESIQASAAWLDRLEQANERGGAYPRHALAATLARRWWSLCRGNTRLGWWIWRAYRGAPPHRRRAIPPRDSLNLLVRCALAAARMPDNRRP